MEHLLVRAPNPGPLTLTGTNTWIVGRDPCWVVDPGPLIDTHLEAVAAAVRDRGGAGGIAVTHDHHDHVEMVGPLKARLGDVPVAAMRFPADVRAVEGLAFGPLRALHLPGHAPDHVVWVAEGLACTGDAVLGAGSVFVPPDGGGLAPYLDGLRRLRALELERLLPGHGPEVEDPAARIDGYLAHRADRERRLLEALAAGLREEDDLLDAAWSEVSGELRPAAALTLRTHMDKLRAEGRLPAG
jgi:glyoxylase-like metal-dependent hydrolase (beta-lactamase superfamily II)